VVYTTILQMGMSKTMRRLWQNMRSWNIQSNGYLAWNCETCCPSDPCHKSVAGFSRNTGSSRIAIGDDSLVETVNKQCFRVLRSGGLRAPFLSFADEIQDVLFPYSKCSKCSKCSDVTAAVPQTRSQLLRCFNPARHPLQWGVVRCSM
jgi:hypothetical protein